MVRLGSSGLEWRAMRLKWSALSRAMNVFLGLHIRRPWVPEYVSLQVQYSLGVLGSHRIESRFNLYCRASSMLVYSECLALRSPFWIIYRVLGI